MFCNFVRVLIDYRREPTASKANVLQSIQCSIFQDLKDAVSISQPLINSNRELHESSRSFLHFLSLLTKSDFECQELGGDRKMTELDVLLREKNDKIRQLEIDLDICLKEKTENCFEELLSEKNCKIDQLQTELRDCLKSLNESEVSETKLRLNETIQKKYQEAQCKIGELETRLRDCIESLNEKTQTIQKQCQEALEMQCQLETKLRSYEEILNEKTQIIQNKCHETIGLQCKIDQLQCEVRICEESLNERTQTMQKDCQALILEKQSEIDQLEGKLRICEESLKERTQTIQKNCQASILGKQFEINQLEIKLQNCEELLDEKTQRNCKLEMELNTKVKESETLLNLKRYEITQLQTDLNTKIKTLETSINDRDISIIELRAELDKSLLMEVDKTINNQQKIHKLQESLRLENESKIKEIEGRKENSKRLIEKVNELVKYTTHDIPISFDPTDCSDEINSIKQLSLEIQKMKQKHITDIEKCDKEFNEYSHQLSVKNEQFDNLRDKYHAVLNQLVGGLKSIDRYMSIPDDKEELVMKLLNEILNLVENKLNLEERLGITRSDLKMAKDRLERLNDDLDEERHVERRKKYSQYEDDMNEEDIEENVREKIIELENRSKELKNTLQIKKDFIEELKQVKDEPRSKLGYGKPHITKDKRLQEHSKKFQVERLHKEIKDLNMEKTEVDHELDFMKNKWGASSPNIKEFIIQLHQSLIISKTDQTDELTMLQDIEEYVKGENILMAYAILLTIQYFKLKYEIYKNIPKTQIVDFRRDLVHIHDIKERIQQSDPTVFQDFFYLHIYVVEKTIEGVSEKNVTKDLVDHALQSSLSEKLAKKLNVIFPEFDSMFTKLLETLVMKVISSLSN